MTGMIRSRFGNHVPDILDCLAQLSNDEVPTPPKIARSMLDLLPPAVWSNPDYKWLDPCCKSVHTIRTDQKREQALLYKSGKTRKSHTSL